MKRGTSKIRIAIVLAWSTLVLTGLMMSISAPSMLAQEQFGDALYFFKRQLFFALLATAILITTAQIPYRFWFFPKSVKSIFWLTPILLGAVFLFPAVRKVHRWIHIFHISFQPSEMAKFALILYISYQAHRHGRQDFRRPLYGLIPISFVSLVWGGLVLLEPDLGNTVILFCLAAFLLFIGGTHLRYFAVTGVTVMMLLGGLYLTQGIPGYWIDRIEAFTHPAEHVHDSGYQQQQSMIALGHGGIKGVGYSRSLQKLYYLPEPHNDYVFAILGEEFGFTGTVIVELCYCLLLTCGIMTAERMRDEGGRILAWGLSLWIGIQSFANMSVVVGLFPPKGLVLPFLSYSGTALLFHSLAIGILLSLQRFQMNPTSWFQTLEPSPADPALSSIG